MKEQIKTPEKRQLSDEETAYQMHSSKHWLSGFSRNSLGTSTALKKKKNSGSNEGCIM